MKRRKSQDDQAEALVVAKNKYKGNESVSIYIAYLTTII